ncbi:hypothetical protein G5714_008721 [Onychostoma macrolepis]|uniref:Reverse transcriptase n=1 Tax=Onychostoma macrolepis TaxID=369639 RepID=A0A7J6CWR7_9TELE|nr:hypothetical protein G5714_008721 [Onychostoma macrolepis]
MERQKVEAKRRCNVCGGLFKNERSVKIHQGKSKCKEQSQQRRAPELTQSNLSKFVKGVHQSVEEVQGQEANHSAPDLPAQPTRSIGKAGEPESPKDFERKPCLNLPPAADFRWAQLDNDLNTILENILKGDVVKKIKTMVEVVYQVEGMERLCSKFLRKWLGVPQSFSAINLYSKTSKLPLPVSSVVEEFKAAKARAVSTLLSSEDGKVRRASKTIKCGRKWKPQQAVMEAEFHWKHQEIVGVVCQGRLGLGHYSEKRWSRADARARRGLVVQRVREAAEEERQVKAIGLASQGRWTQWDQAQERPLSWKELWQIDQGRLSFLLRSVTDLLPTPRNIKIWGGEEDPSCNQCGAVSCTLNHILTGCPKALAEGRYRWRHDKVLMEIAKWVEQQRVKANNKQAHLPEAITFVREGAH